MLWASYCLHMRVAYKYIYIYIHTYLHTYKWRDAKYVCWQQVMFCIYARAHVCMYRCVCVCVDVRAYVCLTRTFIKYVFIQIWCTLCCIHSTYIYIYIYNMWFLISYTESCTWTRMNMYVHKRAWFVLLLWMYIGYVIWTDTKGHDTKNTNYCFHMYVSMCLWFVYNAYIHVYISTANSTHNALLFLSVTFLVFVSL
jgi:hypothetical protein